MEKANLVEVGRPSHEQRGDATLVFHLTDGPHGPCLYAVEVVEPPAGPLDGDWPHDDE
jgi:hypothetical protein